MIAGYSSTDFNMPHARLRTPVDLLFRAVSVFVGLLSFATAPVGAIQPMTPDEIVRATLAHSPCMKAYNSDIRAAEARQTQARAQALPALDTKMQYAHYEGLEDATLGASVTIPAIQDRYSASIGITQPVYTGGRISRQQESTAFQKKSTEYAYRAAQADLILQALTAYWTWSKAYYSADAFRAAVARMEAHALDTRNLKNAGLATDSDALAAAVLLDQTRLQLEDAQRDIELAQARLTSLTGNQLPTEASPLKAPLSATNAPGNAEPAAMSFTNRPDWMGRKMEAKSLETLVGAYQADSRPQVYVTARYEQARPNSLDFPPEDRWQDDAFVGAVISWNIWDWGLAKAKAAETAARAARARYQLAETEERISLEVREAQIAVAHAYDRAAVAERLVGSAQRNVAVADDLWRHGLSRQAEVLEAHAQLTAAQTQLIAAGADILIAQAARHHALGLLQAIRPAVPTKTGSSVWTP
jgi:outer membrane protein TolC